MIGFWRSWETLQRSRANPSTSWPVSSLSAASASRQAPHASRVRGVLTMSPQLPALLHLCEALACCLHKAPQPSPPAVSAGDTLPRRLGLWAFEQAWPAAGARWEGGRGQKPGYFFPWPCAGPLPGPQLHLHWPTQLGVGLGSSPL